MSDNPYIHTMRWILFLTMLCTTMALQAQMVFSTTHLDFGDVYAGSDRFADILVTNKGRQKSYILRVVKPMEVAYLSSSDILLPDSSFSFRLAINPHKKGSFSYEVQVFTSDSNKPVNIRITGNLKEVPEANSAGLQRCPDFGSEPSRVETAELTIITVDQETRVPLSQSTVTIIRNGLPAGAWITGRKGNFQVESAPGYFYFLATHAGYLSKEAGVYVGPKIREITIPLKQNPTVTPEVTPEIKEPTPTTEVVNEEPVEIPVQTVESVIEQQLQPQLTDSVIRQEIPALAEIPVTNFTEDYFKPVNVVFVLDISASMKMGDKMELMKFSLNQLVQSMRKVDHIGLVTYSDEAQVLLQPTTCDQKDAIRSKVSILKPLGMTAGGKGIKMGFKLALQQWSADKTNMVIIITDGAFNKSSDDYQKVVRKYAKKGIIFSVVGIQNRPNDEEAMREAATYGKGRYVPIHKLSDAQYNLLQEIRIASFRGI